MSYVAECAKCIALTAFITEGPPMACAEHGKPSGPATDTDPIMEWPDGTRRITRSVFIERDRVEDFRILGVCPACFAVVTVSLPITPEVRGHIDEELGAYVGDRMVTGFYQGWKHHLDTHRRKLPL